MAVEFDTIQNFFKYLNDDSIFDKAKNAFNCNRVKSVKYYGNFRYA